MFPELNSYFSVPHSFAAYLLPWPQQDPLPNEDELRQLQSTGLQLLTEVKALEADCLMQLRHLDNEAKAVVDFLKLQSRKVDLVLQHVLEKQVQEGNYHLGVLFGGSGISISSKSPFTLGSVFKTHLYIRSELVALLCFCTVVKCTPLASMAADVAIDPSDVTADAADASTSTSTATSAVTSTEQGYLIELEFSQILDTDVEQLVKASLNVQQKMLKKRKAQRQQAI